MLTSKSLPVDMELFLDIEALRRLVTRPIFAKAVWSSDTRKNIIAAATSMYGKKSTASLEDYVCKQALISNLQSLSSLLNFFYEDTFSRGNDVIEHIRHIFTFEGRNRLLDNSLVSCLMQVAVHVALFLLLSAKETPLKTTYRRMVDFIRREFPQRKALLRVREKSISTVKSVAQTLFNSGRQAAVMEAKVFVSSHPILGLTKTIREHSRLMGKELRELWMESMLYKRQRTENPAGIGPAQSSEGKVRGRKEKPNFKKSKVPDFFSDAECTSSSSINDESKRKSFSFQEKEDQQGESQDDVTDNSIPRQEDDHHVRSSKMRKGRKKGMTTMQRSLPPRRSKRNLQYVRFPHQIEPESSIRSESVSVEQAREVLVKQESEIQLVRTMDGVNSEDFAGSESVVDSVDHIARHSQSRRPLHRGRRRHKRRKRGKENDDPSVEHASADDAEVENMDSKNVGPVKNSDKIDESLKGLYHATEVLSSRGPPDPLPEAVRDANTAKCQKRKQGTGMYSPNGDDREVSPIPESDNSVLRHKKRSRATLDISPPSKHVGSRKNTKRINGKYVKSGRFEEYEDELLVEGLRKYGYGAWVYISRDFGDCGYTRAPGSLKDRARTMMIDPEAYPVQATHGPGRPRGVTQRRASLVTNRQTKSDCDEDEKDPIEEVDENETQNEKDANDAQNEGDSESVQDEDA